MEATQRIPPEGRGDDALIRRLEEAARRSPRHERYRTLEEIGRGGMGRVLRVFDLYLQRVLAMKVVELAPGEGSDDEREHRRRLARFVEEARLTSRLGHPGVVPVHEIAVDEDGRLYFTMPLVRGQTLRRVFQLVWMRRHGWTATRAVGVLLKVCETVAFAHSHGVIHRDLKPANVMVGPFGEAYVMDWGLAKLEGRAEGGSIVGTPAYMAPEQAAGDAGQVGPLSDVYSLGAMLYELLAGHMPHEHSIGDGVGVDPQRVLAAAPTPLEDLDVDPPPELVAICEKAMQRDPGDRYASAMAMADDLRAYLENRVVAAHATGWIARTRTWMRRNRAFAAALQLFLLVGAVGLALFVSTQRANVRVLAAEVQQTRRKEYAASLRAIELSLRVRELGDAQRRLAACDPALRGWEWSHLALSADTSLHRLRSGGDRGEIRAVALHPDGRTCATAAEDGIVSLWDVATGERLESFPAADDVIIEIAYDGAGETLAFASWGGDLRLRDLATGKSRSLNSADGLGWCGVAFSSDGTRFAAARMDGDLFVWDTRQETEPAILTDPTTDVQTALAFEPGSMRIAVVRDREVVLVDAERRETVASHGFETTPVALAFHPDALVIAVGTASGAIFLLDTRDLSPIRSMQAHPRGVRSLAFSGDGSRLFSGSFDATIRAWDPETLELVAELLGHTEEVNSLAADRTGSVLVSGSDDRSARIWDPTRSSETRLLGHSERATALAYAPDGSRLATAGHDRTVRIWDPGDGRLLRTLPTSDVVDCLAWSPAGGLLAFGTGDGRVRLVDAESGEGERALLGHESYVTSLVFDPGGARLVSRSDDQTARVWDVASGRTLHTIRDLDFRLASVAIDPGGTRVFLGEYDGRILVHDLATGDKIGELAGPSAVDALVFSPDGTMLASACLIDSEIVLWDVATGTILRRLIGHDGRIASLAFDASGHRLASGAHDHTVRIWDADFGDLLLTLRGHAGEVAAVAFRPDGSQLASASWDESAVLWLASPTPPPP